MPGLPSPRHIPTHMGSHRSKGEIGNSSVFLLRHPRSEPIRHDTARFRARSNSHPVAVRDGCTNIPLAAGKAQEDETLLQIRLFKPYRISVRPTWIRQD